MGALLVALGGLLGAGSGVCSTHVPRLCLLLRKLQMTPACTGRTGSWASPAPRRVLPAWPMKSSLLPSHPMDGPRLRPGLQVSPCPPQHGALLQAPAQHPELKGCHLGVPHSRERAACALHSLTYQGTGDEFGGGSPVKCHGTVRTQTL